MGKGEQLWGAMCHSMQEDREIEGWLVAQAVVMFSVSCSLHRGGGVAAVTRHLLPAHQ